MTSSWVVSPKKVRVSRSLHYWDDIKTKIGQKNSLLKNCTLHTLIRSTSDNVWFKFNVNHTLHGAPSGFASTKITPRGFHLIFVHGGFHYLVAIHGSFHFFDILIRDFTFQISPFVISLFWFHCTGFHILLHHIFIRDLSYVSRFIS